MPIQLPRYSSRALPTEEVLSPQESAQAAAVPMKFAANVTGAVAEFAEAMYLAEQNQQKNLAVAQAQADADALLADPKYERLYEEQTDFQGRPVVDEGGDPVRRPMEDILAEDYGAFEERTLSRLNSITSRKVRTAAQAEIAKITSDTRLKAFARANEIMVTRAKATGLETGALLEDKGLWNQARDQYRQMFDDGLLTPDQLDNNLERVTQREVESPYMQGLLLTDAQAVEELMTEAAQDAALGTKQRLWVKNLRSHLDSLQADRDSETERRQQENAVRMWGDLPNLTVPQIERLDVPYNQRIAAIKAKRSGAQATGAQSDPQAVENIESIMNRWTLNPNDESLQSVLRAIGREADAKRITQEDAGNLMNQAMSLHNRLYQDTNFSKIDALISARITGTPSDEIIYNRFDERFRANLILDYRNRIRQQYLYLARTDPTFDLWEWWTENEQRVMEEVNELTEEPPSSTDLKTLIRQGDYATALSLVNEATYENEAKRQIAINALNEWQDAYNAGEL